MGAVAELAANLPDIDGEEWRAIEGWPYEVSNLGRVRRVGFEPLRPRLHSNGYIRANLCRPGEIRDFYVHRLVCKAFHGPAPFEGAEVDHRDKARANNLPSNLRWVTVAENRAHRTIYRGSTNVQAKLTEADVRAIRASRSTHAAIAETYGVSRRHVTDIINRVNWRHVDA